MQISQRELWTLNVYRNSELHGALLMGRLARSLTDTALLAHTARHCATEARHAAMLSETIVEVGGRIDPHVKTVQEHYSAKGGVPASVIDVLVLSTILERRVRTTYRAHVEEAGLHPAVLRTLSGILREMEEKEHRVGDSWLERALGNEPHDLVAAANRKWQAIDADVAADLMRMRDQTFPAAGSAT